MFVIESNGAEIADRVIGGMTQTLTDFPRGMAEEFWAWQTSDINRPRPNITQVSEDAVETIIPWLRSRSTRTRQQRMMALRAIRGRPRGSWAGGPKKGARPLREVRTPGVAREERIHGLRDELMEMLVNRMRDYLERRIRWP